MIAFDFVPEKQVIIVQDLEELDFYTMWQDRFSDTDDIKIQEKEVNKLLTILRKPRTF